LVKIDRVPPYSITRHFRTEKQYIVRNSNINKIKSGFTVGVRKRNSQNIGCDLAKSEIAATAESDSPLISEDGSIAVKLK